MSAEPILAHVFSAPKGDRLIRLPEVCFRTGLKKSTIYKWIDEGRFPAPIKIGNHFSAWRESEVDGWIEAQSKNGEQRYRGVAAPHCFRPLAM